MSLDYWKRWPAPLTFTNPGDKAEGEVIIPVDTRTQTPELHVRQKDGMVRVVRVTHARLHELLAEILPNAGDRIRIVYTGDGKAAPGMSPAKQFTVQIRRAGSPPPDGDTADTHDPAGQEAGT